MTKDEALDLALEALEYWAVRDEFNKQTSEAITAIKQARSAPVQEPAIKQGWDVDTLLDKPAAQRQWTGLTDEEIQAIDFTAVSENWDWLRFARAIEAKLREKNT